MPLPAPSLQAVLDRALRAHAPLLLPTPAVLSVAELRCGRRGDFPEGALVVGDDMTAGVVVPPAPGRGASAVLAFEPHSALAVIEPLSGAHGTSPVDRYLAFGYGVVQALSTAALGGAGALSPIARLEEDSVAAILLSTHAPPDATLLSAGVRVRTERRVLRGVYYLLCDAKQLVSWGQGTPGTSDADLAAGSSERPAVP